MIRKLLQVQSIALVLLTTFAVAANAQLPRAPAPRSSASPPPSQSARVSDRELALHVLNRFAFGPRPGDVERVVSMGVDSWIDAQLAVDTALDKSALAALEGCNVWREPLDAAVTRLSGPESFAASTGAAGVMRASLLNIVYPGFLIPVTRDSASRASTIGGLLLANGQLAACKLARNEFSENQMLEVMTDFWHNHFSFFGLNSVSRASIVSFDREAIRPQALGRFRDLLGAVAHSPAMLQYLDNAISTKVAVNENYGRELLELHTLGVDGGYTQSDVVDVARAFTGWSHTRVRNGVGFIPLATAPVEFVFNSVAHDSLPKTVLGHALAEGRGVQDGEDVLDILARHPSTARFIARKLAVRFVSDTPPPSLVDRAADVFTKTDGDIREVVRSIAMSPEFRARNAIGAKVKSPVEFVLSLRRLIGAPVDTAAQEIDFLVLLNQPPYGRQSPDGWPETGVAWLNAGAMMTRLEIISALANSEVESMPLEKWAQWNALSTAAFDVQLNGVIAALLNGQVSSHTRATMTSLRPAANISAALDVRTKLLRELVVLALGSPEFQRR